MVFLGYSSGGSNTTGTRNTFAGSESGNSNSTGNDNTFLGYRSGFSLVGNNSNNVLLGSNAGINLTNGGGNVFVGFNSGNFAGLNTANTITLIGNSTQFVNAISNAAAIGNGAAVVATDNMILGNNNTNVGIGMSGATVGNRLEINTDAINFTYANTTNTSGLRFTQLTSASPASVSGVTRVLTLNNTGDVIFGDIPGLGGPVQACSGGLTATNYLTKITASNQICTTLGIFESSATYPTVGIGLSNTAWLSTAHKLHIQGDLLIQRDNSSPGYIGGIYMYNGSGIQRVFAQYGSSNYRSLVIGADAGPASLGSSTASGSIYIGYYAGRNTANHNSNIFIGDNAGVIFSGTGSENIFIGTGVADLWDNGSDNTVLGFKAADDVLDGDYNTYLGSYSGSFLDNGDYNVFIGYGTSLNQTYAYSGDKNVFVGANASGFDNGSGTDLYNAGTIGYYGRVYCDNCFTIGAQFSSGVTSQQTVGIGIANPGAYTIPGLVGGPAKLLVGNMGGTQPTSAFFAGDIYVAGAYNPSDAFLKTNIQPYTDAMQIIDQLEAKSYDFNQATFPTLGLEPGNHVGFMADEVSALLPQLVRDFSRPTEFDSAGNILYPQVDFKAVNYSGLIPILFTAIKQQQTQLDSLTQALSLCCSFPIVNPQGNRSSIELSNHASIILNQNSPNPFKEKTDILYSIPESVSTAMIIFYDQKGMIINSFEIEQKGEGVLTVYGENLTSGMYNYSLVVDGEVFKTKKMIKE